MPDFHQGVVGAVNLTIESDKACPTANTTGQENKPVSIIGGFLTSFALLTSIYFILGTAYNMSVNKGKNICNLINSYRIPRDDSTCRFFEKPNFKDT
jgi:hypothetical protein